MMNPGRIAPLLKLRRVLLLALPLVALVGCDARGIGQDNDNTQNQNQNLNQNLNENLNQNQSEPPVEVLLTVYGSSGEVVQTRIVHGMGPVTIAPPADEPDPPTTDYVVMAQATDHYTRLFDCAYGAVLDVQLDEVPGLSQALTGVVIRTSYFAPPSYHADAPLQAYDPNGVLTTLSTNSEGRYQLTDGTLGSWLVEVQCEVWEEPLPSSFELPNGADTDYHDLFVEIDMSADAPNLYLYPHRTTEVSVELGFPVGGEVVLSDPPYEDGWNVTVSPDGTIDGAYPYLFYEARLPYRVQRERGWLLAADTLDVGLREVLTQYGFVGREVTDFLEFWLPLMTDSPFYAIHPMAADELVTLHITPAPDRLRRLWLFMEPLEAPVSLEPPRLPELLQRDGFTAVEWGAFLSR